MQKVLDSRYSGHDTLGCSASSRLYRRWLNSSEGVGTVLSARQAGITPRCGLYLPSGRVDSFVLGIRRWLWLFMC